MGGNICISPIYAEAKANLSRLIELVQNSGEPVIFGKAGKPLAVLSAFKAMGKLNVGASIYKQLGYKRVAPSCRPFTDYPIDGFTELM